MSHDSAHLFPFAIDKEGPINTKYYFQIDKQEDQYESVVLGRKLIGKNVKVGSSTQGFLYEKEMDQEVLDSSVWKKTSTTIDEFILWRKDNAPEKDDPRHQVLEDWIDLSKAIHEPIPLPI